MRPHPGELTDIVAFVAAQQRLGLRPDGSLIAYRSWTS
jgi:hypothetical protein